MSKLFVLRWNETWYSIGLVSRPPNHIRVLGMSMSLTTGLCDC